MEIFQKTAKQKSEFNAFINNLDGICQQLEPYEECISIENLQNIRRNFLMKIDNFFQEDRKLNIGVIGRMKSGKSTFVNTLLFDGKNILPNAVTPKTATLTKIEYGENNSLEVDFYNKSEWEIILEHSKSENDTNQNRIAREIVAMVERNHLNPSSYVNKEREVMKYENCEELMNALQEYVSENGQYTPFVKSTIIYIDNEDLIDLTIVDTPGYDELIESRTSKTKDFIEVCDVVFFLSKASSFMNHEDIDLFMNQLPNKGVKKMVFIGSRFDDALRDFIWNCDTMKTATEELKKKLLTYGMATINKYRMQNYNNSLLINDEFNPVFVSSSVANMLKKDASKYTEREKKIYDELNLKGDLDKDLLTEIANFDCLHNKLNEIMDQKDEMLKQKADSFVFDANEEVKAELIHIKKAAEQMIQKLENGELKQLDDRRREYNKKLQAIVLQVDKLFDEWLQKLDAARQTAAINLRSYLRDDIQLPEKEGARPHFELIKRFSGKWFLPWTWGLSDEEIRSYNEKYKYLDTADALDNIQKFTEDSAECIEDVFRKTFDSLYIRHQLFDIVINSNDIGDDNFFFDSYRKMIEEKLEKIKIPKIFINGTGASTKIASQFTGEMIGNQMTGNLKTVLTKVMNELFEETSNVLELNLETFKSEIHELKKQILDNLTKDLNESLKTATKEYETKKQVTKVYHDLIDLLVIKNRWVE